MLKRVKHFINPQMLHILSFKPFLSFILSVFISTIAINMLTIILILQVYSITHSNLSVALLVLTVIVPQIFVSLLGGVVADIENRKNILIYGNFLRFFFILLLFLNPSSLQMIYFVSLVVSIITYFYIPAENPFIPLLVEKEYLTAANSLFGIFLYGSVLIAYVFGAPLSLILGRSVSFLFIALLFLATSFCIMTIPGKLVVTVLKQKLTFAKILEDIKKTYDAILTIRFLFTSILMIVISQIVVFMVASLVPGYATSILQIKEELVSFILFGPAAIGMIISAFIIDKIQKRIRREVLPILGIGMSAAVFLLLAGIGAIPFAGLRIFCAAMLALTAGFANAFIFVPTQTIIQEKVPSELISKMYGFIFSLTGLASLFPILVTGILADVIGTTGVFVVIAMLLGLLSFVRFRNLERSGVMVKS